MNWKDTTITVLSTIIAVFIILVVIGLVTDGNDENTETEPAQTQTEQSMGVEITEDQARASFIGGCAGSGEVSREMCGCMFDRIRKEYTLDEIGDWENMRDVPERAFELAGTCYAQQSRTKLR